MTTLQLQELRRLIEEEGHTCASAARLVGVRYPTAYDHIQRAGVGLSHKWGPDKLSQYGAYDRKTDELVALGNCHEVAAQLGITVETLRTYVTKGTGKCQIVRLEGVA